MLTVPGSMRTQRSQDYHKIYTIVCMRFIVDLSKCYVQNMSFFVY